VSLIGPVKSVAGMTKITFPERTITSQPKYGTKISVKVPTHVTGLLNFENGAVGTIITSFDVWGSKVPRIEIHGTEGSLNVPDPNTFGGPVSIRMAGESEWREMPLEFGYVENSRSIGTADMAYALKTGRPHRASGSWLITFWILCTRFRTRRSSRGTWHWQAPAPGRRRCR